MDISTKVIEFLVSDEEKGIRVDKACTLHNENFSRSYFKKLILSGHLFINNKKEVIIMAKTADGKKKVYVRHPTTPHYRSTPNKKGN